MKKVIIVGAGLCGTLLAIRMAQRGYSVALYERRSDMRAHGFVGGRSINLALSDRGIQALKLIGLEDIVQSDGIPMRGRMIHDVDGKTSFYSYSGRSGEHINSISRGGLNLALIEKADTFDNLNIHFNHICTDIDFDEARVSFQHAETGASVVVEGDVIIGTDGAGSAVRQAMMKRSNQIRFDFSQSYLSHGYKELSIPAASDGGFRLEKGALHIWPRGEHMLIALPNLDGSFTVTLFQDFNGSNGLEALDQDLQKARQYFEDYFPDALAHMPDFENDFTSNPSSSLGTIKCFPWQTKGVSLLMGDAAHAIVPFYGQGMNASFEDVFVFDTLLEKDFSSWEELFSKFQEARKPNTDAIADLAVDNFYEMRDYSGDALFQKKVMLEKKLEHFYPKQYYSKYSMVTFRRDMGYREAMIRGRKQDKFLLEYCRSVGDIQDVNYKAVLEKLEDQLSATNQA